MVSFINKYRRLIPKIIIQTHRNENIYSQYRQTWIKHHTDYQYLFFSDRDCEIFFKSSFPEILDVYRKLPLAVQKADLFRYSYIYLNGGFYSDADTICLAPINEYLDVNDDSLIVGLEMTPGTFAKSLDQYTRWYCFPFQILQWTFGAPPRHPALRRLLQTISWSVRHYDDKQLANRSVHDRFTLELTGPMMFTKVLLSYISDSKKPGIRILDQNTWGYNHYHQGSLDENPELRKEVKVQHLYASSWRNVFPDD